MFKQKSNAAFNNDLFNDQKIGDMHETMKRLYLAANELHALEGQSAVARKMNLSPQRLNNWEARGMSKNGMLIAEQTIGCSALWIETGAGNMRAAGAISPSSNTQYESKPGQSNAEDGPEIGRLIRIPVVGMAQLGDNGYLAELETPTGFGDGHIPFPAKSSSAYALRCRGDSMKPRIKNGEFVIVDPGLTPAPGDEVLVKSKDGRVMVKELLYIRDGMAHLLSVNESHGKLSMAMEEIEFIHGVAGIMPPHTWVKG